ncbi:MAG: type IV secretory system conjugative DNA transfer family protein [Bacilli bacterium]|nr:type IV secretory system conjugative DNA transfer family protein [Bacilli bacterium]MDD4406928.1 type IV secretory system conjugative DNA transfer family protein [Bacilli bacterium]
MKLRVTSKDLIIFAIFCFFLLYLSAIAVLNVTSLLNEGVFFGLVPFAAFAPPYLGATIVVFMAVLISIFVSVSSYIFDREGGFGLNFGEKEVKGYSRWSKDNEIKNAKDVDKIKISDSDTKAAGVPLINNGKEMWVDNGENHTLVIGATASGKTTAVVDPLVQSLAKAGESMILTDPKGELHRNHSEMLKSKGYNIIVLNFRNPGLGNAWNPLTLPYKLYKAGNTDKATELLDDVALNILRGAKTDDPFWESSAADYFSGLSLGLFEDATEKEIHLNSISYMSTVGEEKFATSDYIKEYFLLKGESSSPYVFASNTINAPNETKGGILSVFRQKIRLFSSREQLSEMLSYSDFDIREIGTKKTAVFMIIHDEKTTYHALATIFIKQCYETLIDVAQENGGKLLFRTNFILDEFANMPPLKDVTAMVTAARSRKIRFTFIIQNFAQLNDVYGKDDADTIRSNCGNLIYLITTELAALEEISKLCGEVKSKEKEKTSSTPLITVSDLQKMKLNEVVILKSRLNPFRTKLTPSYEIDWGYNFASGTISERKVSQIELFNIKDFVKTKKRNKLFESLENFEKNNETNTKNILNPMFTKEVNNEKEEDKEIINIEEEKSTPIISFNPLNEPLNDYKEEIESEEPKIINNNITDIKDQNFNIEDLIKRIDAKILEFEKEEQEQNKKEDVNKENDNYDKLENTIYERFDDFIKTSDNEETSDPEINVDRESIIVDNNNVTDDQFYDDFFTDSER